MAPDARRIELGDAWIATPSLTLHVKHALFRLPPFVRASSLPAPWRATFLATSGATSGLLGVGLILAMQQRGAALSNFHAFALGAAGPVSCLALLHLLERAEESMPMKLYASLPVATALVTLAVGLCVWSLPGSRSAATK